MNIMLYLYSFLPVLAGCSAGFIYGFSFLLQHRNYFSFIGGYPLTNNRMQSAAYFLLRIGILFVLGNYLLRMPLIPSILGSIGFFCMFWLIILQVKAKPHERN